MDLFEMLKKSEYCESENRVNTFLVLFYLHIKLGTTIEHIHTIEYYTLVNPVQIQTAENIDIISYIGNNNNRSDVVWTKLSKLIVFAFMQECRVFANNTSTDHKHSISVQAFHSWDGYKFSYAYSFVLSYIAWFYNKASLQSVKKQYFYCFAIL